MNGVICGSSLTVVGRVACGVAWCFQCRARVEFETVIRAPDGPSYYGPSPSVECPRGHVDGDLFPGRIREWS